MPKIEIGGDLVPVMDCPECGRTVLGQFPNSATGIGFVAKCGRRLVNISECGTATCPETEET